MKMITASSPVKLALVFTLLVSACPGLARAQETLKPFVLASTVDSAQLAEVGAKVKSSLVDAGFDVIGEYAPYDAAMVMIVTSNALRELATRSERGGYGAALRVAVTRLDDRVEVTYTNPHYWANVYRMQADVGAIAAQLQAALGNTGQFGSGELSLNAEDLREYHYTFMMEYFDDPSILNYFDSHDEAVATVRNNLAEGVGATRKIYELQLGADSKGKAMTLFGVALDGVDDDDCSSDSYIMGRIDKDTPRHTAHLPYEILVYGDHAEALYARFRIAVSWPHLPMMASDTGATFFSIMCAPGAIESTLTNVAGGARESAQDRK